MNDVLTQNNIAEIVDSAVKSSTGLVMSVIKSIDAVIKKSDSVNGSINKLKKLQNVVVKYNGIVSSIISTICIPLASPINKSLSKLLGRSFEDDLTEENSTKSKKIEKWTTVEAMAQIPNIINSAFKAFDAMSKFEGGILAAAKLKLNILKLKPVLNDVFNTLIDTFTSILNGKNIDLLLSSLVAQPDTILNIVENSKGDKSVKAGNEFVNDTWNKSKTETLTERGKLGLLDIFDKTFSLLSTLNTLKLPNLISLYIKIKQMSVRLKLIFNMLGTTFNGITKQINTKTLNDIIDIISNKDYGVCAIFKSFETAISTLLKSGISRGANKSILRTLNLLNALIHTLFNILNAVETKYIASVKTHKRLDLIKTSFVKINAIISSIDTKQFIIMGLFGKIIVRAIKILGQIIDALNEALLNKNKKPKEIVNTRVLDELNNAIDALYTIQKKFVLMILIAPLAIIGAILTLLFVGVLTLVVMLLNIVLKTVASFIDNAKNNLRKLSGLILQLFIIGMMMIGLALIAETVVRESLWILAFLGVVIVLAALIVLIGLGISQLSAFVASGLAGFAMIVLAIGMLFVIALMMKAIEMIKLDSDKIKETVKDIVSACTVVVKLILFGDTDTPERSDESWIVTLLKGIGGGIAQMIGAFIAVKFLAQAVSAIFFVLILAVQLRLIQMIDLDVDKIKENVRAVVKTCKELVITLLFGDSFDSAPEKGNENNWILNLLKNVGSTFIGILGALVAVRFLAMSLASVTLILILAKALSSLQEINLDTDKIKDAIARVIDCSYTVIFALIMQPETSTDGNKKSWLEKILTFVGGQLISYLPAMLAIRFLATTVGMVLLMKMLASLLSTICKFELNIETIRYKVADIIDAAYTVIFALILPPDRKDEPNKKSWVEKILTFVGGQFVSFIPAILAIRFLATTVGMVLLMKMLASMLIDIIKFDFDPNEVKKKVDDIVSGATSVMDALLNRNSTETTDGEGNKESGGFLEWIGDKVKNLGMNIFGGITDYIGILTSMPWLISAMTGIGIVSFLVSGLKRIMEMPNLSGINTKVNSIVSGATSVIDLINNHDFGSIDDDKLEILEQITDIIEDFTDINGENADGVVKVVNSYANFIDKVNTVDVTKLETSTKMFEQMARFSESIEGDFDELAETLSDKLLPVLTELKEVMSVLPEKIDVGFQNTSASIAATGTAPTRENYEAQLKRENPNLSQADVDAIVTARLNEKATTEANGITAKLDELMTLLKGFSGDRVIVQTV